MTRPFSPGFTCWTPETALDTIMVDAVMPSPAVFLATHTPMRILRRELDQQVGGVPWTEQRVLADFLESSQSLLLMPIIGASGTGKSHLVRWLHENIPESATRRVVYIPKYGTNLRRVIELILEGLEGPEFEDLKTDLEQASAALTEKVAARKLLDSLAISLDDETLESQDQNGDGQEHRSYLRGGLPLLLRDVVFSRRLLADDGVIYRLVREALYGKSEEDKDEPFEFVERDLPTSVADAHTAAHEAQEVFRNLVGSQALRATAVTMLNERLGPAIRDVFGMPGTRLYDVMLDVRRRLLEQGTELLLLIEDFTLLQGIQRELLDAIIEAPEREGEKVLCSMRTAMAVTSGYFDSIDTARTRAAFGGFVYSLDVLYGDDPNAVTSLDAQDFVGRYLNAARAGRHGLDAARENGDNRETSSWVPNVCETCPEQDVCHESFGKTRDGYGLYPLNSRSLDRVIRARNRGMFDAREVLKRIRLILTNHHQEIEQGRFPSDLFDDRFRDQSLLQLNPGVALEIERADPRDASRRKVLLTFWGGVPDEVVNLAPGVHEVFQLPQLEDKPLPPEGPEVPIGEPPAQGQTSDPKLEKSLDEITKWTSGDFVLSQSVAADLRRAIHSALVAYIDWNADFLRPVGRWTNRQTGRLRQAGIEIENGAGGGVPAGDAVHLALPISAENATLFQGLLRARSRGDWAFPGGGVAFRILRRSLEAWSKTVLDQVRAAGDGGTSWDAVPATSQLLLVGARILGIEPALHDGDEELVEAIFHPAPTVEAERSPKWNRLMQAATAGWGSVGRHQLQEHLVDRIGAAQGAGEPLAIDACRLMGFIHELRKSWVIRPAGDLAPSGVTRYRDDFETLIPSAMADELDRFRAWHSEILEHLGEPTSVAGAIKAMESLRVKAILEGVLAPPSLLESFKDTVEAAKRVPHSLITEIGSLLSLAPDDRGEVLKRIAPDREAALEALRRFVEDSKLILEATESATDGRLSALSPDPGDGGGQVAQIKTELSRLEVRVRDLWVGS